ncbi:MAG TPA: fasciclin domain-containing protein [Gemmatimonadaceae bacterium]
MTKRMLATMAVLAGLSLPALASAQSAAKGGKDLVQVAAEAGSFKTLLAAVEAAGLVEVLRGPGPFTVFAPTDAAFAKLPAGTLEALLADKKQLAAVLTYHVVPGRVTSGDVVRGGGATPATVQGERLSIVVRNGGVQVDGANVTAADVMASNGVIHVIDTVVLPGQKGAGAAGGAR